MKKSLIDILNTERGQQLVANIEEAEAEICDRGIDENDESEFWVRARKMDIEALEKEFGYLWK